MGKKSVPLNNPREEKTSRSKKFYRTVCSVYDHSHVYHLCRAGKESQKDEDLSELVNKHIGIVRVKDWPQFNWLLLGMYTRMSSHGLPVWCGLKFSAQFLSIVM